MNRLESNNQLIKKVVEIDESDSTLLFKDRRNNSETRYKFKFNHLFYSKYCKSLKDNQSEIYSKIGKPYIQNLLEGSDLCYFAYGQTGSGKSYTIMGDESTPGIVFRFAKQLFEIVELNSHRDLDQFIKKLIENNDCASNDVLDARSDVDQIDTTESTLLAAKRQLYQASIKYGFTDVIDGPESSLKKQENSLQLNFKSKDKILRFDENIKCYKDDHIYHEKLFASDSELSSLGSCKSFDANEQSLREEFSLVNKDNLNILKSIMTRYCSKGENSKIEFAFKISYYEIYSESIYDLLEPGEERIKSKVREHPTSGPYIVDLTMRKIQSMQELNMYYDLGNRRRSKSSTSLNDQSSRSHAIFTIYITQTHQFETGSSYSSPTNKDKSPNNKATRTTRLHSKISFVDLAGSERASTNDQPSEDRLKEGNSINKSLLTLGKVITKLAWINKCIKKKNTEFDSLKCTNNPLFYVPYRDSVLTWLLKDCFNGKCKTFMIATIAPSSNHYDQTLSTLRYAHKASKIKVSFKFNQVIVSNQVVTDHRSNDSKRLFIENMIPRKKTFQQTSSENISGLMRSNEISFDSLPEVNTKLINTSYKSSLIEKIREIFNDIL